jgi:hypothetical protein
VLSAIPVEVFARHPHACLFAIEVVQAFEVGADDNTDFGEIDP